MPSANDLAWLAGFIDGEGSICLLPRRTTGITPACTIYNTDLSVLEIIRGWFGGQLYVKRRSPKRKPVGHLVFQNDRALRVLHSVRPYLRVKHRQADLALVFEHAPRYQGFRRRVEGHYLTSIPNDVIEFRKLLVDEVRALNKRGPKENASSQQSSESLLCGV